MDVVMVETDGWVVGGLFGMTGGVSNLLTVLTRLVMAVSMAATRCSRAEGDWLRLGGGEGVVGGGMMYVVVALCGGGLMRL